MVRQLLLITITKVDWKFEPCLAYEGSPGLTGRIFCAIRLSTSNVVAPSCILKKFRHVLIAPE